MKVAVIGLGMMGINHMKALRALGYGVDIVMDTDAGRARKVASDYAVPAWTTDFADIEKRHVDSVHICTPPAGHYSLVRRALEDGMHVVCEKPLVFENNQANELAELARSRGLVNAVGFNVRYHQACAEARDLVEAGKLGQVLLVHGSYCQEFHALPCPFSWRYDPVQAGKFLATTEIGSHWIDVLRYLSHSEIVEVCASYGHYFADRVVKDGMQYLPGSPEAEGGKAVHASQDNAAIVTFRLKGGILANVVLSEITPGRSNYLDVTVTGTEGSFWWNTEDLNRYHVAHKGQGVEEHVLAFGDGFGSSVQKMLEDVYKDIEAGKPGKDHRYADFSDAARNVGICNAIYESANDNSTWKRV